MKAIALVMLFAFYSTLIIAQSKKEKGINWKVSNGNFFFSGETGLGFTAYNDKYTIANGQQVEDKYKTISFYPSFGYFVYERLAVGLSTEFKYNHMKSYSGDQYTASGLNLLPSIYYYLPIDDKMALVSNCGIGFTTSNTNSQSSSANYVFVNYDGLILRLGTGISYFFRKNTSLNFGVAYSKIKVKSQDGEKEEQNVFNGKVGCSIYF
jgi:long-subunit fatty acid transport protein